MKINKNTSYNQYSIPTPTNTIKLSKLLNPKDSIKYSIIF